MAKKPSETFVEAVKELAAGFPAGPAFRQPSDRALLASGLALRSSGDPKPARRAAELHLLSRAPGCLGGTSLSAAAAATAIASDEAWLSAALAACASHVPSNRKLHASLAAM